MEEIGQYTYPRLRYIEIHPVVHHNQPFLLLRDPLQLSDRVVLIPEELTAALRLFDGTVEINAMPGILSSEYNFHVTHTDIEELFQSLNEAFLLDNNTSKAIMEEKLEDYRRAPYRPANLAGKSYPEEADALHKSLDGYLDQIGDVKPVNTKIRGLISPHIDYERGWRVYAEGWAQAQEAVRSAELVVILGTDHHGPDRYLTLTRQHYATPFGVLPNPIQLVDLLADTIGPELAFRGEFFHRSEHSIELAAIWLHHIRRGEACEMLPILCGSFMPYWNGLANIEDDEFLIRAIDVIREFSAQKRTLIVAAADLAHVGPAFGGKALDFQDHTRLKHEDESLIDVICKGDADSFLDIIFQNKDCNNICGVAPIYLAMKILEPLQGTVVAYEHCPADSEHHSTVSICSLLFH